MKKVTAKNEYVEEQEKKKGDILDIIKLTECGYLEWYIETTQFIELWESFKRREDGFEELLRSHMLGLSSKFIAFMPKGRYATVSLSECVTHTCAKLEIYHTLGKLERNMTEMSWDMVQLFFQLVSIIRKQIQMRNHCRPREELSYYKSEPEREKGDSTDSGK